MHEGVNGRIITVVIRLKHLKNKDPHPHIEWEMSSTAERCSTLASNKTENLGSFQKFKFKTSSPPDWLMWTTQLGVQSVRGLGVGGLAAEEQRVVKKDYQGGVDEGWAIVRAWESVQEEWPTLRTLTLVINNRKLLWTFTRSFYSQKYAYLSTAVFD